MNVSVFGLGYVGAVTSACLAHRGFRVIGVDVNSEKVNQINAGRSPVVEQSVEDLVATSVQSGNLSATSDVEHAVRGSDVSLICVGTPSKDNGDLDVQFVERVCRQVGTAIAKKSQYHLVVLRSTVLPGTTECKLLPILENTSGKKHGSEFGVCFNPEFLREGSSVQDFRSPPFTLVGVSNDRDCEIMRQMTDWIEAEFISSDIRTAEMLKYVNNGFHALKVVFVNEVGRLCRSIGVDSHQVMDLFCKDTKQNISTCYLKPGYAFGGSCLPKDLRAILHLAKSSDVPMELFHAMLSSNQTQVDLGVRLVEEAGNKQVGVLGLSFKSGTDDLRESPLVALVETLYGRGYEIKIYDESVSLSRLVGTNKAYVERELPHVSALLEDSWSPVIDGAKTIVIGNHNRRYREILSEVSEDVVVIDLVRLYDDLSQTPGEYQGIGW